MGKKGNWFSALKRAFTSSSKDNSIPSSESKYAKENKKWGLGKSKHGETNSFIPLYREPSSVEKILGTERDLQHERNYQEPPKKVEHLKYSTNQETPKKVQHSQPPNQGPSKRVQHVKPAPTTKPNPSVGSNKRAITASYAQISVIRIQAAYRGYLARKNYRALKGLVRLQRVMRGQSVKRQTTNTMKCMQLLVRVQSQVRARRLQMIESKNHQHHQTPGRSEKEMDNFSRWSVVPQSEAEGDDEWDDSVLTKEERDARTRRKVEAVIKRERALAYAYSHQLLKVTPKSAHAVLSDVRSGSFPWWWSWLDRQLPHESHPSPLPKTPILLTPRFTNFTSNASKFRPNSYYESKRDISETPTPRSSKAMPSPRTKNPMKSLTKWNQHQLRDDESLTSCPAFRVVPNYMVPTVSAKAKVRDSPGTTHDGHDGGKKRFSFSLNQSIGSFRWSKGPLFPGKETKRYQETKGKHRSTNSIGGMSMDSTVSLPVGRGRRPFK